MDDEAHVAFVDAHAKGVGGHHHLHPVVLEILLAAGTLLVGEACVVPGSGDALLIEHVANRFDSLAGRAVDDACLTRLSPKYAQQVRVALFAGCAADDLEIQIRSVKAGGREGRVHQAQMADDVLPDPLGSGCCERAHHRPLRQLIHEIRNAQVHRAEILPPLGHAVGFVHGDHGDLCALGKPQEGRGLQPLRGDIDDLVHPLISPLDGDVHLPGREGGVQVCRRNARGLERRHLIRHEGDQRRNHQRDAFLHQCGHLIAHRLARAGGHHAQGVPSLQERIHHGFLAGSEMVVAEIMPQRVKLVHRLAPFVQNPPYCTPFAPR